MTTLHKTFKYEPLSATSDSFRLLQLHPSSDLDAEIEITVFNSSLTHHPIYEALSYVWGPLTLVHTIKVNSYVFSVTQNLKIALQYLRLPNRARTLWIDQICIDQASLEERGQQIMLMNRIYPQAVRGVAWLGVGDEESERTFDLLGQFLDSYTGLSTMRADSSSDPLFGEGRQLRAPTDEEVRCLTATLQDRPLWDRIWIVQEIALGKQVALTCGKRGFQWWVLDQLQDHISGQLQRPATDESSIAQKAAIGKLRPVFSRISPIRAQRISTQQLPIPNPRFKEGHLSYLKYLLMAFGSWKATDARDKVYAVLGLCKGNLGIIPDYKKSVREVYIDATSVMILRDNSLGILCCGRCFGDPLDRKSVTLPSWVPDYSYLDGITSGQMRCLTFRACGMSEPVTKIHDETLVIQGRVLGVLDRVSGALALDVERWYMAMPLTHRWGAAQWQMRLWEMIPSMAECKERLNFVEGALSDVVWRTIVEDVWTWKRRLNADDVAFYGEQFREWYGFIAENGVPPSEKSEIIENMILLAADGMNLGITRNNLLAKVPFKSETRDVIAVLDGTPVPVVLRPATGALEDEGMKTFRLAGTAYVHGFMDGQIMSDHARYPSEVFTII